MKDVSLILKSYNHHTLLLDHGIVTEFDNPVPRYKYFCLSTYVIHQ
jgi:hypothetical protein